MDIDSYKIKVENLEQLLKISEIYNNCNIYVTIEVIREMEQLGEKKLEKTLKDLNSKQINLILTFS